MNSPIFIAGPDRSGTTLLYAVLASHPNISMVRRTNYWRWFYGRFGDLSIEKNLDRLLERMLSYKRIAPLHPDGNRIRKEFLQGEQSYGRLFGLFHEHNAERNEKSRWGDKSLHTEHHVDTVLKEYPQAKIIHTIRDPRDRYASVRKRFSADNPRLGASTARLINSIRIGKRNLKEYPENYAIIRFEDLVLKPERTARIICDFIGEDYDPAMLSLEGDSELRNSGGNSSFDKIAPGQISTKPVGRYKQVLSGSEIAFIQLFTGRIMREFDYPLITVRLSILEKFKHYLWTIPCHSLRLIVWNIISFAHFRSKVNVPENRFMTNE